MAGCPADHDPRGRLTIDPAGPIVRDLTPADRATFRRLVIETWGTTRSASRGRVLDVTEVDGFVAELDGAWAGHLAYEVAGGRCEVALLESRLPEHGVGTALMAALADRALHEGWTRVWLITTNDNTDALRWYQRRGFVLAALHRDAVTQHRRTLKPEIPEVGAHGIPIRDELELELPADAWERVAASGPGRTR